MSGDELPAWVEARVIELVADGWTADEIADEIERRVRGSGRGWTTSEASRWTVRDRRRVIERVAAAPGSPAASRPTGPEWEAIVRKYRDWLARPGNADRRPTQADVAAELRINEQTLRTKLRALGVARWHDVHAMVESEPGPPTTSPR